VPPDVLLPFEPSLPLDFMPPVDLWVRFVVPVPVDEPWLVPFDMDPLLPFDIEPLLLPAWPDCPACPAWPV
jgi:hypothetical protein